MNDLNLGQIPPNIAQLFNNEPLRTAIEKFPDKDGAFANIFKEAIETTITTEATDKKSSFDLITGEQDDLSGMLIDMQKAELALQLTLQIRNKIIDAYNEVMRMSV